MLASLIATFVSGEAKEAARRAKTKAIVYIVTAVLALTGIGFLIGAAYIAAARRYGSFEAALSFGIAFLMVAILIAAVRSIASSSRRRRRDRRTADLAAIAGTAAITALPLLLKSKAGIIAPLLAVVGYMIYRENRKSGPRDPDPRDE